MAAINNAFSEPPLRLVATKNRPCADFPYRTGDDYDPAVILDLDYWAVMPR